MKIDREPPIASSASQPIDLLLGDWIANPSRIVFAIDETRRATPHGELVIYCAIITSAGQALELLTEAAEAREQLPAECQEQGFKGRNFFEYAKQPMFSPYLRVLVEAYKKYVHRIVRLITSVPNIQAAPKSRLVVETSDRDTGERTVRGLELGMPLNLLTRLTSDLGLHGARVDAVIDRSAQFGTDAGTRELVNQVESFVGKIGVTREMMLFFDSDQGPLKDLLLLPDFAGYLALRNAHGNSQDLQRIEADVLSGATPFRLVDADMTQLRS